MTKTRLTVLAAAAWCAALVSSAAFALVMNRPLATAPFHPAAAPITLTRVEPISPAPAPPQHYILPTVEIVSNVARPVTAAPAQPPRPRDISQMKCTHMKALEQGSGGVQICD